jgi:hypothetical protein
VEKLIGAFFNSLCERKQNRNSKWYYKKKNQEFSVVIRFISSPAFENNEGSDKSSFVSFVQKNNPKICTSKKARSDLRTK